MEGNVDRTLARLAEIGYTEVEPAGYHGRTPAEFRRALDANGLTAPAAHIPVGDVRDKTSATIDAARALGARWVVVPWLAPNERTADDYRRVADVLNRAGEAARAAGMRVAYHNHDFELVPVGGTRPLDLLLERTDPNLVDFELDLYWAVKAGADPLAYFSRWPGRFPLVHVKDSAGPPEHRQTDVGAGTINFAQLFAQRGQAGTRHFFVEHDDPADPLAFAAASFRALRALRF
jgi:sugar phosphate isomerase/epimerase